MTIDEIIGFIDGLGGVLILRPAPGDGSPEISWGDAFFYYAPDGVVPTNTQPFATIVTKDYPGDDASRLDRPGAFRVNLAAGREAFARWTGHAPRESAAGGVGAPGAGPGTEAGTDTRDDPACLAAPTESGATGGGDDTVIAHPVYGALGWLAVANPGSRTERATRELLRTAYLLARLRYERRAERSGSS
ncbi:hypothetical protein GCM10023322_62890 [Rugosimonospora acidiphila]|uniref:DUF6194 domain-containing protein n=1 Tax=Rugosimonospora acidiphila TaxID=556531 RepID=A0ABP9SG02_9ACTN